MRQSLALFDFDGTLCLDDSFTQFIFFALRKRHILRRGIKILPWIQAYYAKIYSAPAMRQTLYRQMFKYQSHAYIQTLAQQYSQILTQKLNPVLLAQLQQHQALGHEVVIVSASLDLYLQPICSLLNVKLICTQTEVEHGYLTGEYSTPDCSSEQKSIRIQQAYLLENFDQIYAYGNSTEDLAMLELSDQPYMVGTHQSLPILNN